MSYTPNLSDRLKTFLAHPGTESDLRLAKKNVELSIERGYVNGYREGYEDGKSALEERVKRLGEECRKANENLELFDKEAG